eukprot:1156313-Pelagomonas_calceolata.AAC.10
MEKQGTQGCCGTHLKQLSAGVRYKAHACIDQGLLSAHKAKASGHACLASASAALPIPQKLHVFTGTMDSSDSRSGQPCMTLNWTYLSHPAYLFLPGDAQGMGPESRLIPCQNGLNKAPPGLPDQQRWLGTLSGAYLGASGRLGRRSKNRPTLEGKAHNYVRATGCTALLKPTWRPKYGSNHAFWHPFHRKWSNLASKSTPGSPTLPCASLARRLH